MALAEQPAALKGLDALYPSSGSRTLLRVEITNPRKRSGYMLHQLHVLQGFLHSKTAGKKAA